LLKLVKNMLNKQPLRRKLLWVVMLVVFITVASTFTFLFFQKNIQQRDDFIRTNIAFAKLVSDFTILPLVFDDKAAVAEQLGQLSKYPQVAYLILEKGDQVLSKFDPLNMESTIPAIFFENDWTWSTDYLFFKVPISFEGKPLGVLKGAYRLDELKQKQLHELYFMIGTLLVAMLLSYIMTLGLRRFVLAPILRLEQHARANANKNDAYDLMLSPPNTNDEINSLYQAFNLLMRRIQQREAEIKLFNKELENQVLLRTEELRAKSEELDNYFNNALDLFCIADYEGYFLKTNTQWQQILGYTGDELLAHPFLEFVHPDDISTTFEAINILKQQQPLKNFVNRYRDQQGRYHWIEWSCVPRDRLIYAAARDITERRKAEEHLRLANSVYQNSSEAMIVIDQNDIVLSVNPAFTAITGYTEEDVLGQKADFLLSKQHTLDFYQNILKELDVKGTWQGEIENCHKEGQLYVAWITINNIYDNAGALIRRVGLFYDITQKKKSEEEIWFQANYDPLTGLPNRRLFGDRLHHEILKAKRDNQLLALFFLDLDRFKEVNDTFGHRMGDTLLIEAARRVSHCIRQTDTVARLGGDEFTVVLTELVDASDIDRIAQSIIDELCQPFFFESQHVYVSASLGIALYPTDAQHAEDLIRYADQAMYAAKNRGRNGFCYFTPSMQEKSQRRMQIVTDLHMALQHKEFQIYYQPIVDLQTGEIYKAEALIRWQHPIQGLLSPNDFISIAEEHGLIYEIGEWVFQMVNQQLKSWLTQNKNFQISVNVSPLQFQSKDSSINHWPSHLQNAGVPQDSIIVEITEGLLLEANDRVVEKLIHFAKNNIQIAIDDFGTGYSSLSYLKKYDVDYLKIDKSFILQLTTDANDLAIVKAILTMARQLGFKVIAEGIETELQRDILLNLGCDYGQGYLFAKPMTSADFESFLDKVQSR